VPRVAKHRLLAVAAVIVIAAAGAWAWAGTRAGSDGVPIGNALRIPVTTDEAIQPPIQGPRAIPDLD
jgi:hypothetical protein